MALALYRKYRPRTFAEVIGQEHVTEPLSQALRSGRLHHAYLFSGPRGCGKTSSARILARSLNCEQGPTPEPCGTCASCRSLANDGAGSIDVIEIDAASHGGVDDARDLREKAFFAPASSRYKIYVIDEAHMVSSAGFNALLKLVEEPPEYVKFIFATTEPEKVLGTIRSRTHHYPFRLIPPATLRPYLQQLTEAEGVHVDPAVFPLVVRAGGGSARDSLSVLDQLIAGAGPEGVSYPRAVALLGVTDVTLIDEMCDALAAGDGAAAYQTIDRVAEAGHDARRFASDLLERFRDLIILQQVPDAVTKGLIDGPADQLDQMAAQATRLGPATLSRCADIVHNGLVEMRGTTAPRLLLELITARMLLPGADDSSGALLQRLERMERRLTLTTDADPVRHEHPSPQPTTPIAADAAATEAGAGGAVPAGSSGGLSAARAAAAAAARRTGSPAAAPGSAAPAAAPASAAVSPADDVPASAGVVSAEADAVSDSASTPGPVEMPAADPSPTHDAAGPGAPTDPVEPSAGPAESEPVAPTSPAPARAPEPRRAEPAGIMPDAPDELGSAADAAVPGQLSAAAIREVWHEIIGTVGRKSKKIAALAQGATVRDLDGQTVVLTFRFPAHARMVAAEPQLIADALYEALGGRWQIRCDVAGESGPSQGTSRGPQGGSAVPPGRGATRADAPQQVAPAQARTASTREAVTTPQAAAEDDDDGGWPEPARPGGSAAAVPSAASPAVADDGEDDEWPEPVRPGGSAPVVSRGADPGDAPSPAVRSGPAAVNGSTEAGTAPDAAVAASSSGGPAPVAAGSPTVPASDGDASTSAARSGAGPVGGSGPGSTVGSGTAAAAASPVAAAQQAAAAPAAAAVSPPAPAKGRLGGGPAPSSGLAAARAAAARGAGAVAAVRTAPGSPAAPAGGPSAKPGTGPADSWSDGSPTEEAPYDPEYDGPPRAADGAALEGFDPGDEPLDDVIDERTARQSSEQQAVQLLREAFGAEKISES
ncbi:DNA polymerase III subunit gamma and tau [Couchioplanes caeruleus]|uniref:DNA polymerase III subunit gamma and tau n=1 Tax=Couchioplanes caeruleus TaxID=56438 RepID=UPI00201CAB46|nr:DNA polymerase III subunit gamma and tau [Couchioplanes caeruleus]UQU65199.1 DNA polymerase III subunit gamma and tau [Couchioplanes caeruleus]